MKRNIFLLDAFYFESFLIVFYIVLICVLYSPQLSDDFVFVSNLSFSLFKYIFTVILVEHFDYNDMMGIGKFII